MRPKILVTGATGFIGKHLTASLLKNGFLGREAEIILVCRDKEKIPPEWIPRCRLILSDLRDIRAYREKVQESDYVFHLAASRSLLKGRAVWHENMESLRALLDALRQSRSLKRIVFTSSISAVDRAPGDPCLSPLTERTPPYPSSFYGRSKLDGEKLLMESGLPYAVLRVPFCFGPGMNPDSHLRVFIKMILRRNPLSFFNWPGRVSLIEIKNCVNLLIFLASDTKAENQIFFATDGPPVSFGSLFEAAGRAMDRRAAWIPVPGAMVGLIRRLRRWMPVMFKSLFLDALWVQDKPLRALDYSMPDRPEKVLWTFFTEEQKNLLLKRK